MAALALSVASEAAAESLLSMPQADLLKELGAPEALPRTRKAQLIYPAPGLPSLIRPGQEIVARVRVRRAMTPPPGIPQYHVLLGWGAQLVSSVPMALPGTTGDLRFPLLVHQIRPEDEGFVYRVRLKTPVHVPPGVYDLEFEGPGFRDTQPRSVRVLGAELERLELVVVDSGESLWQEVEGLALLDPAAVVVPGGLREATLPLSRWRLATFSVVSPDDVVACRTLEIDPELAGEVAEAARCDRGASSKLARCVADALGAEALRSCGDGLVSYGRSVGPPAYAVGLGDVTLVGLNTSDLPLSRRAERHVRFGDEPPIKIPLSKMSLARGGLGSTQRRWLDRVLRFARDLIVVGYHPPGAWQTAEGSWLREALEAKSGCYVAAGRGSIALPLIRGPAIIELLPVDGGLHAVGVRQHKGLDPGRFKLGAHRSRPPLAPAGVTFEASKTGLALRIHRPPPGRLRLRLLVPVIPGGWSLAGREGRRRVSVVSAYPGSGEICDLDQVLLIVEVSPGDREPLSFHLVPAESRRLLDVGFQVPSEGVTLARDVELRAVVGDGEDDEVAVFWDLGDRTGAIGPVVRHRYLESGPARVCAVALDRSGRAASATAQVYVERWGGSPLGSGVATGTVGGGLIVLSLLALIVGLRRWNILGVHGRLS